MCSGPHDPDGDVRGCSVGCTIGVSDILASCVLQPRKVLSGVSRTKAMFFQAGVLYEVRRNFVFFCRTSMTVVYEYLWGASCPTLRLLLYFLVTLAHSTSLSLSLIHI